MRKGGALKDRLKEVLLEGGGFFEELKEEVQATAKSMRASSGAME